MDFKVFGKKDAPVLMLVPGLGVSYEIFIPLIHLLENEFQIVAVQVDGFVIGKYTEFTSIDDQAVQVVDYVKRKFNSHIDCAYGLSLGGKILSRVLEHNEIMIEHAILDVKVEVFKSMNHGQFLVDFPEEVSKRIKEYNEVETRQCFLQ